MKKLTLHSKYDAETYLKRIYAAADRTVERIRTAELNGLDLLERLKFEEFGTDPLDLNRNLNVIEQINQTFTYIASLQAAEYLLSTYPGTRMLHLNLGTTAGFDIESDDHQILGEVFAATRPSSNNKLNKDVVKLQQVGAKYKYVFFVCPNIPAGEYNPGKYGDVTVWSLSGGT